MITKRKKKGATTWATSVIESASSKIMILNGGQGYLPEKNIWIQHAFIWGSVTSWYSFLLAYGLSSPVISGNAFMLLPEVLGPAPIYWCATLIVTAACNLPYLVHICFQRTFNPLDHHVIQEIKYYRKDEKDQYMWMRERSKARQETKIGFTARVDAKIRQLKGKLQKRVSSMGQQPIVSQLSMPSKRVFSR